MQVRLELQIKLYNFVYIINLNLYNYEEIKPIVDVDVRCSIDICRMFAVARLNLREHNPQTIQQATCNGGRG